MPTPIDPDNSSSTPESSPESSQRFSVQTGDEILQQIHASLRGANIDLGSIEADRLDRLRHFYEPSLEPNPYTTSLEELRQQRIRNQASVDNSASHIPLTAAQVAMQIERDRRLARSNSAAPAFHIPDRDRSSFGSQFGQLFSGQSLFILPDRPLWQALQFLLAQIPGSPPIEGGQFITAVRREMTLSDGQVERKFTATCLLENGTRVCLNLKVALDLSTISLLEVELNREDRHPRGQGVDIGFRSTQMAVDIPMTDDRWRREFLVDPLSEEERAAVRRGFDHRPFTPGIFVDVSRTETEGAASLRRQESADRMAGAINFSLFGAPPWLDRQIDQFRDREQEQILSMLTRKKASVPAACQGCANYFGETHGGNTVICGMYPYGPEGDSCEDFEAKSEAQN